MILAHVRYRRTRQRERARHARHVYGQKYAYGQEEENMRALDVKSRHVISAAGHHILSSRVVSYPDDTIGCVLTGFSERDGCYVTSRVAHDYYTDVRQEVTYHRRLTDVDDLNCLYGIHDANVDTLLGDLDHNVGSYHNFAVS